MDLATGKHTNSTPKLEGQTLVNISPGATYHEILARTSSRCRASVSSIAIIPPLSS